MTFENAAVAAGVAKRPGHLPRLVVALRQRHGRDQAAVGDAEHDDDDRGAARLADRVRQLRGGGHLRRQRRTPTWRRPIRTYFRREAPSWTLVGLERLPERPLIRSTRAKGESLIEISSRAADSARSWMFFARMSGRRSSPCAARRASPRRPSSRSRSVSARRPQSSRSSTLCCFVPCRTGTRSARLVRLWEECSRAASRRPAIDWSSRSTYAVWRERTSTLDALGGYALYEYHLAFGGEPFKVFGAKVSPAVLSTLRVAPALGRFLTDDDDREGAPPVVIISDGLWRERYGSSPGVPRRLARDRWQRAHDCRRSAPGVRVPGPSRPLLVALRDSAIAHGAGGRGRLHRARSTEARRDPGAGRGGRHGRCTFGAPKHRLTEFFFGKGGPVVVHARALRDDMTAPARPALSVLAVAGRARASNA